MQEIKMITLPTMLFILSACGEDPAKSKPIITGDPVLVQYAETFLQDAESIGRDIKLKYSLVLQFGETRIPTDPVNKNRVGYCQRGQIQYIVIEQKFFDKLSHEDREGLLYHELGHCILGLDHREGCRISNGTQCLEPVSIMHPSYIENVYGQNKPWYLQELFSK